jgi:DNA-binding protein H-NS
MLYEELKEKAAEILRQAEEVKAEEKRQAIEACKAMIASYGITASDLKLQPGKGSLPSKGERRTVPPKYRDPVSGATWSGRGKSPRWINGHDKSAYVI